MLEDAERWFERRLETRFTKVVYVTPTPPEFWQKVVSELAKRVDVVIFDLSNIGDGLAWEVEVLLPQLGQRAVFFGAAHAVQKWLNPKKSGPAGVALSVRTFLAGRQVLVERSGRLGNWQFRSELSRAVLSAAIDARDRKSRSTRG
jgi:hypothetical protein